jgi:ADP-ribose pyrophosphatase YjhB (NUDIX family)
MSLLHGWRVCPRCGAELEVGDGSASCDSCGSRYYAASFPTASGLLEDDAGRVLLACRGVEPARGKWDIPGGFLEEDEDPLDGLRRELREETGLEVAPVRYLGAFMDTYGEDERAIATLNLMWVVRAGGGEPQAADDVAELRWFPRDELPPRSELAFDCVAAALDAWRRDPVRLAQPSA